MNARERKRFLICIGLSLAVGLLLSGSFLTRLNPYPELTVLQNIFVDTVSFKGREGKAEKVVLAQIDEKSVSSFRTQYGRPFSWPRTIHAQVLRNLADAGARVVAYDMLFDAPGCRAADGPVCQEDNDFGAAVWFHCLKLTPEMGTALFTMARLPGLIAQVVNQLDVKGNALRPPLAVNLPYAP